MIDLQGPVIRTGEFKDKSSVSFNPYLSLQVNLKAGQQFKICCNNKIPGDETFVPVDFKELESKLKVGDHVIVDFGAVCMSVVGFETETDFLAGKKQEGEDMRY